MTAIIKIMGVAGTGIWFIDDVYLAAYDPDGERGLGSIMLTADPSKAQEFRDKATAMQTWNLQSSVKPIRRDGQPNKPLTVATVEIIERKDNDQV